MDKQVLQSTKAVKETSHYAIAILHENEFHLTPLRGIVHLRPSFGYLDKADKRSTEKAKDMGDGKQLKYSITFYIIVFRIIFM